MAGLNPVPDLVKLSKLTTEFHSDPKYTQHITYGSRNTRERRRIGKEERWIRSRRLGRGGYGTVWLEQCIQGDRKNELRAVKEVPKHGSGNYNRELEAIALFSHENYDHCFVKSFGWYEDNEDIFIAMEFFPEGDLGKYLGTPLPEEEAQDIAAQVLEGLQFMHDHNFAHRDLKPDNILVACKGPNWWVKIADFGISKRAAEGVTALRTLAGTPAFAAPEVLQYIQVDGEPDQSYTNTVDIWSLSVILFFVLTGESLFQTPSRLIRYITGELAFPSAQLLDKNVSENGRDFLKKAMQPRPESRPRTAECRQHSWVQRDLQATKPSMPLDMRAPSPEPPDPVDTQPSARWSTQDQMSVLNVNELQPEIVEGSKSATNPQDQLAAQLAAQDEAVAQHQVMSQMALLMSALEMRTPEPKTFGGSESRAKPQGQSSVLDLNDLQPEIVEESGSGTNLQEQTSLLNINNSFPEPVEEGRSGWNISATFKPDEATSKLRSLHFRINCKPYFWDFRDTPIAFSPNGENLASGSLVSNNILIWDIRTERLSAVFGDNSKRTSTNKMTALAFSPDGQYLVSASYSSVIRLWDLGTKQLLRTFAQDHTTRILFSPDGRQLASYGWNTSIKLWDVHNGTLVRSLMHTDAQGYQMKQFLYSPDGRKLACISDIRNDIMIWDISIAKSSQIARGYVPLAIAYSADGRQLLSVLYDGIQIWDPNNNILIRTMQWPIRGRQPLRRNPITEAYFSPNGQQVVTWSANGIYVIEGERLQSITGSKHYHYGADIVFSPDGNQLALRRAIEGPQGVRTQDSIEIWAPGNPTNSSHRDVGNNDSTPKRSLFSRVLDHIKPD